MSTQPNNKNNDWIWLPAMIICFAVGLWPFALVILFWKVFGGSKKKSARRVSHPYDRQKQETAGAKTDKDDLSKAAEDLRRAATDFAASVTDRVGKAAAGSAKTAAGKTAKGKRVPGGTGLIIAGAIVAGLFGIGTMGFATEFFESLAMGYFFADELTAALTCLACLVVGLILLCVGIGKNRRRERWLGYLAYIGANRQVALAPMAAAFGVSVRRLCDDLRKMPSEKVLPNGYLDLVASSRLRSS